MPFTAHSPTHCAGRIRTSAARVLLFGAFLTTTACVDSAGPVAPSPGKSPSLSLAQVAADETPDQLAVAQVVPGFGGYFIDATGAPTVYLTDLTRKDDAAAALAGFLSSYGWTSADLKAIQANYDYLQLTSWYQQVWPQVLALSGAVSSDIDEAHNRLRFTGVDASVLANMASVIGQSGVPNAATILQVRGPVRQVSTLRDKVRPPFGGYQIEFFPLPASPLVLVCTMSFNAVKDGVNSFVTASHCSNVQGGITVRTDYYQPTRSLVTNPDDFIGFEVDDPDYFTGGECPLGRQCRYSDALRAQFGAGQAFVLGKIARTSLLNDVLASDSTPYLTVNLTNPSYAIAAEQPSPVQGQLLNKVGRTSGWTQGAVVATCENVDVSDSQITQLCQSLVDAYVDGGDSGSDVFGFNTDGTVNIAGVLWGSSTDLVTGAVQFIFSPFGSVERELGALSTIDPTLSMKKRTKRAK